MSFLTPNHRLVLSAKARRFLNVRQQASLFRRAIPAVEARAAAEASAVSQATFRRQLNVRGRPVAPARFGRPTTLGHFASDLIWLAGNQGIGIDMAKLPRYALIQEVGTGRSARILNPPGQITIPSQIGRAISANLYWGTGVGGNAVGPRAGANGDQLYYASELNNVGAVRRRKKRIRREIKGKHFLQAGGQAGYLELRTGLVDEAKRIFK